MKDVLVTGGAGFIGSHLVDALIENHHVTVLDDLSGGHIDNISSHLSNDRFKFIEGSISSKEDVNKALDDIDTVFHFAAQPDVRRSVAEPYYDFGINVVGSLNLLEMVRERGIKNFIFASSGGTVYGDTDVLPTPETVPLRPISNYGAAKGAFEMYLSSYTELYGIDAISMRLANIIGPRSTHGVIFDFYMKLKNNPKSLSVLGNGSQEKTYMYVTDTVNASVLLASSNLNGFNPINVGSNDRLKVSRIAELVIEEMGLVDATIEYTGGNRGWTGDIILTDMDVSLLKSLGWKQEVEIEDGVRFYVSWIKNNAETLS
ncbi:MAG: NAD-dependent epimerase/dehydratase family protein [Candidatus Thorarchaeota archaeon]